MSGSETPAPAESLYEERLRRQRRRILPFRILAARPRLFIAFAAGIVAGLATPEPLSLVTRALIGWDAAAVAYLALVVASTFKFDLRHMRFQAQMLDDGRWLVLIFSILAPLAAIGAIVAELGTAKAVGGLAKAAHLGLAGFTIVASWLFIHMVFALHYAHEFYSRRRSDADAGEGVRAGLIFPDTKQPTYIDFAYFSYVIGVASQTADVSIASREMRMTSLFHSILSFFFNTTILALTINIAAGLF